MSMSLFKSPEYAQEVCATACSIRSSLANLCQDSALVFLVSVSGAGQVWSWLDKHGDTPVLRENFKHLVGICTLRPSKAVSKQSLQRRPSGPQQAAASARRVSDHAQTLVQQGSTRFIPAASVSGKPAPPPRPASAAATRRKHATAPRPSTAAPSMLDSCYSRCICRDQLCHLSFAPYCLPFASMWPTQVNTRVATSFEVHTLFPFC